MSRLLLVVGLSLGAGALASAELPQAPAPRLLPVEEWVKQLASADATERDAAEKRLSALALDPPPELLAAAKSDNPDLKERAAKIAQSMRWNVAATRLPRGERFAKQGRIDLFVAATAEWNLKADDARLWEQPLALGRVLIDKAELKNDRRPSARPAEYRDFAAFSKQYWLRFTRTDELYTCPNPDKANPPAPFFIHAIQALEVASSTGLINALIVSRDDVRTQKPIDGSVIFANGDVTARGGISSSIIVCDGNVSVAEDHGHLSRVLVIARGNITTEGGTSWSTLIAGGKIAIWKPHKLVKESESTLNEKESHPLSFVTFFELHRVGLKVKVADGAVAVDAIAAETASAKAGLKVGDVILEANGKKPTDAESLRRLLRDSLALGDAPLKVKRGNETLTIKLALPD